MRIPVIWLCLCAVAALAADPARPKRDILRSGPKPPVERFPPQPYVAPPTPSEKAQAKADAAALREARLARRQAVSNLLDAVGIVDKRSVDAGEIARAAAKINAAAESLENEKKIESKELSPVR